MAAVVTFGGESLSDTLAAVVGAVGPECLVHVLPTASCAAMEYQSFQGSLDEAGHLLRTGEFASVQLTRGKVKGGIYCPRFCGEPLRDWIASVEDVSSAEALFDVLLDAAGLSFVVLSQDESPDFDTEHVTVSTLPWDDWHIVAAAARNTNGTWRIRRRSNRTSE